MRLLLDTHILLWGAFEPERLSRAASSLIESPEIAVTGAHAAALASLPPIHKDPFDRMLVAQAMIEGLTLLTADPAIAKYPGPVRFV